jgi:hypothetical protein
MTMKMDREFTIKRRKHPSAPRYPGRANQELGSAITKLLSLLDIVEREQFADRCLVLDEEGTSADFDAVLPGDTVGVALEFEDGYLSTQLKVDRVENDIIFGKDLFTEDDIEVTFEEASAARAMGYFEILYRPDEEGKDVPYGVDTEVKVKVMVNEQDPGDEHKEGDIPASTTPEGLPDNIEAVVGASTDSEALKALLEAQKNDSDNGDDGDV